MQRLKAWVKGSALADAFNPSTDLFGGVEKPSITLAKLLVAEMLQNLGVKKHYNDYYVFPSFRMNVSYRNVKRPGTKDKGGDWEYDQIWSVAGVSLTDNPSGTPFCADELKIFSEGYKKFKVLADAFAENEAEGKRQMLAVSLIEKLFKKEPECPPKPQSTSMAPSDPGPDLSFLSPAASTTSGGSPAS